LGGYIIKRVIWIIPVMLSVLIIVFSISYFAPGDPVSTMLGSSYTEELYAKKAAEYGLDRPYIVQLGSYIWNIVTKLDLGKSLYTNIPVAKELSNRLPITFKLSILGICLMVILGLPTGMVSALKQYSAIDATLTSLSLILAAIPSFVLALLCAMLFGVMLKWLPVTGLDTVKSHILPVCCPALSGVAVYMRITRTTMLEVIRQDYIRTARAKGLKESVIIRKHALMNCMIPLSTVIGGMIATVFSGSIIAETIFSIPGMGMYMLSGISTRDYPIINGTVIVLSAFVCVVTLAVDILYAFIDPRIKANYTSSKKKENVMRELLNTEEGV